MKIQSINTSRGNIFIIMVVGAALLAIIFIGLIQYLTVSLEASRSKATSYQAELLAENGIEDGIYVIRTLGNLPNVGLDAGHWLTIAYGTSLTVGNIKIVHDNAPLFGASSPDLLYRELNPDLFQADKVYTGIITVDNGSGSYDIYGCGIIEKNNITSVKMIKKSIARLESDTATTNIYIQNTQESRFLTLEIP